MCIVFGCLGEGRGRRQACDAHFDDWLRSPEYCGVRRDDAGLAERAEDVEAAFGAWLARIRADRGAR